VAMSFSGSVWLKKGDCAGNHTDLSV